MLKIYLISVTNLIGNGRTELARVADKSYRARQQNKTVNRLENKTVNRLENKTVNRLVNKTVNRLENKT